jgi:hypothetical protein
MRPLTKYLLFLLPFIIIAQSLPAELPQPLPRQTKRKLPSVDQILERYVTAIGGKEAWFKLKTRTITGKLRMKNVAQPIKVESLAKAPNQALYIVHDPKSGAIKECYDGKEAWVSIPQRELIQKTGPEFTELKRQADFHLFLRLKSHYPKMKLVGVATVKKRTAYVIEAIPDKGRSVRLYFDTKSGLWVREDSIINTSKGPKTRVIYFEDYRTIDGVKIAYVTRHADFTITIEEIRHNISIPEKVFQKPQS